jgi:SAM-dependent methyltransferase
LFRKLRRSLAESDAALKEYVHLGYKFVLRRQPDKEGFNHHYTSLVKGEISKAQFLDNLVNSNEFLTRIQFRDLHSPLHASRVQFIKSLPKASRILDLGGSSKGDSAGAFVTMGYPYDFDELIIVDLPLGDRHKLYVDETSYDMIETKRGWVRYKYQSMTDFTPFESNYFDLVYSGQSLEHITPEEGEHVCREVFRTLRPGGYFCLDTPNGRVCRMQQEAFVDPDHKVEYSHEALSRKLMHAGFEIIVAAGLNHLGSGVVTQEFSADKVARNVGCFHDIENCYLLSYVCQKASTC